MANKHTGSCLFFNQQRVNFTTRIGSRTRLLLENFKTKQKKAIKSLLLLFEMVQGSSGGASRSSLVGFVILQPF